MYVSHRAPWLLGRVAIGVPGNYWAHIPSQVTIRPCD